MESAVLRILRDLERASQGQGVEVLTYKRNRGIAVIKKGGDLFWVRERGYKEMSMEVEWDGLHKVLKSMMKREFPRSRKVRLYRIKDSSDLELTRKTL